MYRIVDGNWDFLDVWIVNWKMKNELSAIRLRLCVKVFIFLGQFEKKISDIRNHTLMPCFKKYRISKITTLTMWHNTSLIDPCVKFYFHRNRYASELLRLFQKHTCATHVAQKIDKCKCYMSPLTYNPKTAQRFVTQRQMFYSAMPQWLVHKPRQVCAYNLLDARDPMCRFFWSHLSTVPWFPIENAFACRHH